jgi:hypothetical protein
MSKLQVAPNHKLTFRGALSFGELRHALHEVLNVPFGPHLTRDLKKAVSHRTASIQRKAYPE